MIPTPTDHIAGVILAGGASSRFGSNKALALYQGRPLIGHAAATLAEIFRHRLLVANHPDAYRFLDWPTAADRFPGAGPLAGIHAALASITVPHAFIIGCDMPFVSGPLVRFLCELADDWDAVVPWPGGRPEPLYALYHQRALPVIAAALAAGDHKIGRIYQQLRVRQVEEAELLAVVPDLTTFLNVNRPADLPGAGEKEARR